MLFMIARGFRITRSSLLVKAAKTYAFISVVVFFFLVTFSFLNPDFYWLTFLVIYFFVLPNV